MKTRTVVERIGENMGPIDWSYDFRSHFETMGGSEESVKAECDRRVAQFKELADGFARGEKFRAMLYSIWQEVADVGMYDGWPYWRPVPSFAVLTHFGVEWHSFNTAVGIEHVRGETS